MLLEQKRTHRFCDHSNHNMPPPTWPHSKTVLVFPPHLQMVAVRVARLGYTRRSHPSATAPLAWSAEARTRTDCWTTTPAPRL